MNTNTIALTPCPFCGGAVMHRHALWPSDGDTDAVIHAESSTCGMVSFSIGTADHGISVAAAWNRRAAIAALEAEPQPDNLAETPTPKPQEGLWTLTAPDGRTYQADSPLRCCGLEQRQRVPADVAMARIIRAALEPDDSELLDWLDATNKRFKMGWKVSVAPAGNCSVQSVICLGNSEPVAIRDAIRAALPTPPKD